MFIFWSWVGKKILETKQKIDELNRHLQVMEETFSEWADTPDMIPDGKAICCLIEKWSDKHKIHVPQAVSN